MEDNRNPLTEYLKNETPEQKEARIQKMRETRKQKRHIETATRKAMKMTWKVPIYEDGIDEDGNPTKKLKEVKFLKTPELIAARLIKEATAEDSKNVVAAVKEIRDILGEKDPEKLDVDLNGVQVVFSGDASKYAK